MKAVVNRQPGGLENTRFEDVEKPKGKVMVRVTFAGLNPVDINVILGKVNYNISPYPHIPGAEFVGVVDDPGSSRKFRKGDRVLVYPRVYDGTCERCVSGREELCRNGGVTGVASNGGFSEFYGTDDSHLEMIPDAMSFEDAVSIPVGGLTAYHAINRAGLAKGEKFLVVGASGNTGWHSLLLGKLKGAEAFYVSRKKWVAESGAREWNKEKVDVIVNSLGSEVWEPYIDYLDTGGRVVTFGTLTGREARLNIASLYTGERSIIGSTSGTRKEFSELIRIVSENGLKSRLWKIFDLSDYRKAIEEYERRDGRIILRVSDV
ncbi:MAG: alcohol dehydrogenase catalytic domain-containing protein [Candidatus Thermoplasmatota archaeon]|nr:alcohol dehydrogenase catalytic domain-containing protein [Candidatus Thermoplasmatota archaeon]MCL5790324.1 alcohol dehydrogenase catalytic domain-containing protein [Candidatus Thermoplasmatota archaeon]